MFFMKQQEHTTAVGYHAKNAIKVTSQPIKTRPFLPITTIRAVIQVLHLYLSYFD